MKNRFLYPVISALLCGYGIQQEDQEAVLEAKVTALEGRVVAVETYLQGQAAGAAAMAAVIDDAVAKGYTAGINFEARLALVDGWKRQIQTAQAGVPGGTVAGNAPVGDPRVERRKQKRGGE